MEANQHKAMIDYPCRWVYKIIGPDREEMSRAVAALLQDSSFTMIISSSGATGKYHCLNVEVLVENEEKRIAVYESLKAEESIKIIL
jgi:hypothetical protein